jgi:predicted nucleic-acid-binding protein
VEWVLRSAYKLEVTYICKVIHAILGLANVVVEDGSAIFQALKWYEQGLDFADGLHLASAKQVDQFIIFDEKFCRQANLLKTIVVNCI